MSQLLPSTNIVLDNSITIEEVLNTADDNPFGFIVECDLTFPVEIHDKLKEFPPCPENNT